MGLVNVLHSMNALNSDERGEIFCMLYFWSNNNAE
jgi:hypothetical protein